MRTLAAAGAGNARNNASSALEVENRFLQLGIQHCTIRDHQHAIKDFLVSSIVQVRQKMSGPGNRIGFAGPSRMLDQITLTGTFLQHVGHQFPCHLQLVKPRKNHPGQLLFIVALADQIAANDFQPAIRRPHLTPQIVGGFTILIYRIACTTIVAAPVKWQEACVSTRQPRSHHHFALAHGKVH